MLRVQRADTALSVPWGSVTGRPVIPASATNTVTLQKIITQVPAAAPVLPFTVAQARLNWAPGAIAPGGSVATTVRVGSATLGAPCIVGTPYALAFGQVSACVVSFQQVQINLTNLSNAAVTLAAGDWRVLVFLL